MKITALHRPMYEGCTTGEEKAAAMTAAMAELQKENDADGMNFAAKTCMAIAYERHVESQREDRLFMDPLASHLYEPYGQQMSDALAFGLTHAIFDPPGADIGLGLEGHVLYTAARTKLINDQLEEWLDDSDAEKKQQIMNLGSGADTRIFWLDCLSKARLYWDVDQESVMKWRETQLEKIKADNPQLVQPKCPRKTLSMDFLKQSLQDDLAAGKDFDKTIPTCWILEGLIMYLPRTETEKLLDDIAELSTPGSYMILNFSVTDKLGPSIDEIDERMAAAKWTKVSRLMFGEEKFNFGRYPLDKPTNKIMGFAMYKKE